jgi:hypothetical protein
MIKLYFVIDSVLKGKSVLIYFPTDIYNYQYLKSKFINRLLEPIRKMSIELLSHLKIAKIDLNDNYDQYDLLTRVFTFEKGNNFIYDISVNQTRYICYPIWINNSKYMKNEEKSKNLGLKMFNIVVSLDNSDNFNIPSIYDNIQAFSNSLLLEEYRNTYLTREISDIFNLYESFTSDNEDSLSDFEHSNNLYKCLKLFYTGMSKHKIHKFKINNWLDFKTSVFSTTDVIEIKTFQTILITKNSALKDFTQDYNPMILQFVSKINPFKSIEEICLENNLSISTVIKYCKQIISWNFGKVINKTTGNSILTISESYEFNHKKEKRFTEVFGLDLYETLNLFFCNHTLEEIYKQLHSDLSVQRFKLMIVYLLENEFVIQNCQYVLPRMEFKYNYNTETILLNKAKMFLKENEYLEFMIEDFDTQKKNGNKFYFEDYLLTIKNTEDYNVFKNVYYYFGKDYTLEQISYLTGYAQIFDLIKKYFYLFDIIIEPIY